uniref:Uncharacterized protein n=1 Tax=Rhizophora mucronata TaxID=61149 RepID=A0A2P2IPV4_RHIMU
MKWKIDLYKKKLKPLKETTFILF